MYSTWLHRPLGAGAASFFWLTVQRYNLQIYIKYNGTSAPTKQKAFWFLTSHCPYAVTLGRWCRPLAALLLPSCPLAAILLRSCCPLAALSLRSCCPLAALSLPSRCALAPRCALTPSGYALAPLARALSPIRCALAPSLRSRPLAALLPLATLLPPRCNLTALSLLPSCGPLAAYLAAAILDRVRAV